MATAEKSYEHRLGGLRRSTWRWIAPAAFLLLAAVGYLVWWMCQPPAIQTVRLRDGARISLGAVTYGTTHRFDPAPPLLRAVRGLSNNLPIESEESYDGDSPETV